MELFRAITCTFMYRFQNSLNGSSPGGIKVPFEKFISGS